MVLGSVAACTAATASPAMLHGFRCGLAGRQRAGTWGGAAAASACCSDTQPRHPLPDAPSTPEEQALLQTAVEVCEKLRGAGCLAFVAGGWVRDRFLGRPARDIDIATSASSSQIRALFRRTIELPRSTAKVQHNGQWLEVTTFRGAKQQADLRSAGQDAGMRDFTINALLYDPADQSVLDFVGGVPDLTNRVLRGCVDAEARLLDDPIRVLRGVRFAVTLGLKLAPDTAAAMQKLARLCSVEEGLPPRRLWLELHKLNKAEAGAPGTWAAAMKLAYHLGLLRAMMPWLRGNEEKAVAAAARLPPDLPLELRVAGMMHPSSKPGSYQQMLTLFQQPAEKAAVLACAHLAQLLQSSSEDDAGWVQAYAAPNSEVMLQLMSQWLPPVMLPSFQQQHQERQHRLAAQVAAARGQLQQQALAREQHHSQQRAAQQQVAAASGQQQQMRQQVMQQIRDYLQEARTSTPALAGGPSEPQAVSDFEREVDAAFDQPLTAQQLQEQAAAASGQGTKP